jgi:aromatic ring-opening dioxygenase catalytic subunit (LigB family)
MILPRVLLVPNRVTLLLDEHRGHQTPMLDAIGTEAIWLGDAAPDIIVALSARWRSDGAFLADKGKRHQTITDYSGFGVEVRYDCAGHPELARALAEAGQQAGLRVETTVRGISSGLTVPLHFLARSRRHPVVPLGLGDNSPEACRRWGAALRAALEARPERIAFIVGGSLSNNEHEWNLKRPVPEAGVLDEAVLEALSTAQWDVIHKQPRAILRRAKPEANLRHLDVIHGFVGGAVRGDVINYEPGPGVGAALVAFDLPAVAPASA